MMPIQLEQTLNQDIKSPNSYFNPAGFYNAFTTYI